MNNPLIEKYGKEARWVSWKYKTVDGRKTKLPYQTNGRLASSTDSDTWSTYKQVTDFDERVGIIFTSDQKLIGIDLDHILDGDNLIHEQKETIAHFLIEADSYTEISPSGTGLHVFLAVTEPFPVVSHKCAPYEIYSDKRYFTFTGNPYKEIKDIRTVTPAEVADILKIIGYPWSKIPDQKPLPVSVSKSDDDILLQKMFASKNGPKIKALYDGDISAHNKDKSSADMALCSHLAFWTRKDPTQMERLWLSSALAKRQKTEDRQDYRVRTIHNAIAKCTEVRRLENHKKEPKEDRLSQADILLKYITEKKDIILFHDEQGDSYIAMEIQGHQEIWSCKSKTVRRWLLNEFWNLNKTSINPESLKSVLAAIDGRASFEGPLNKLDIRFAWDKENLWYDLTNDEWQAAKVSVEGWEIVDKPPIIFKRYLHNRPQLIPSDKGGDVHLLLKYINIQNPQHKLLLLVFLVSCFIPDIAHVILVVFGSQGSAKSTLSKFLRRIIDPSTIDVVSMPDNVKELVQALAHHAFLFFDNVSYISEIVSDILCKAVTGSSFTKRELYSDDEDIIYTLKKRIGINGINLTSTRPDLLERSLILELERIEEKDRVTEHELINNFEKDLPLILGGIFDTLVKALKIKPSVKITKTPRMADFAIWGCAISEALGYTQDDFIKAYQTNISKQTETVLNESIVATALISFMDTKEKWTGTATELLRELNNQAMFDDINTYEKYWPKTSNILMRRLNELKINLKQVGISYSSIPGNIREVHIMKDPSKINTDATDDISPALSKQLTL